MEHISELSTLSWVIYLSSVKFGLAGFALIILSLFLFLLFGSIKSMWEEERIFVPKLIKIFSIPFLFGIFFCLIGIFIPDRQTIMTIAAIEYGHDTQMLKRVEGLLDTFMPLNEGE